MPTLSTRSSAFDEGRQQVEALLEEFRQELEPLAEGQMQVAERLSGEPWVEVTPGEIASLRRRIAILESLLAALR